MRRRLVAAAVLLLGAGPLEATVRRSGPPAALPPGLTLPTGPVLGTAQPPALPSSREDGPLPWFIQVADPGDAAWLAAVLHEAQASKTARATLRRVEKAAERLGRPVIVELRPVPYESFNWDWDVVTMKASLKSGQVIAVPSILMHELTHFLQKEKGQLDTFELELEAYVTDFQVAREMGHTPRTRSWEEKLHKKFGGDLDGFIDWLKDELYKDAPFPRREGLRAYRRDLQERVKASERRLQRGTRRLEKVRAVLDLMRETGQDPSAIETYRREVVSRAEDRVLGEAGLSRGVLRDLLALRDPAVRRRFSAYSRRVMKRLERLHDDYLKSGGW